MLANKYRFGKEDGSYLVNEQNFSKWQGEEQMIADLTVNDGAVQL